MVAVFQESLKCLLRSQPEKKCAEVFALQARFDAESLDLTQTNEIDPIITPGRPS